MWGAGHECATTRPELFTNTYTMETGAGSETIVLYRVVGFGDDWGTVEVVPHIPIQHSEPVLHQKARPYAQRARVSKTGVAD
jgi:hypothetical protein